MAGEIDLSAPVIGDVVQIGWSPGDMAGMPKVGLHVEIEGEGSDPSVVRISRQDQQRLVFGVLSGSFEDGIVTHPVFGEGVEALEFRRREDEWEVVPLPEAAPAGADPKGAAWHVAKAVARFVRKKQEDARQHNKLDLH